MWEALGLVVLVLVFAVPLVPAYVLLAPPVVMTCRRRLSWLSLALWVLGSLLLWVWAVRNWRFNERADVEGTAGDAFAAAEWLFAAVVVASASLAVLRTQVACAQVAASSSGREAPPVPARGDAPGSARRDRGLAVAGLCCAAVSVLFLPWLLSPVAAVLGVVAHYQSYRLGRFVVGAAVIVPVLSLLLRVLLTDPPP